MTLVFECHIIFCKEYNAMVHASFLQYCFTFQIRFMSKQENSTLSEPFRLLGYLTLAQVVISAAVQLYSAWKSKDSNSVGAFDADGNM